MPPPNKEHVPQTLEEIEQLVGTDRWLMNSGLVTESVQQNLLLYGYLSSSLVDDVEVEIKPAEKWIKFQLYMKRKNLKKYSRFAKAWAKYGGDVTSLWGKWRKLRLCRHGVYMNIDRNLRKLVGDYLPNFKVLIEVLPYGQPRKQPVDQEG